MLEVSMLEVSMLEVWTADEAGTHRHQRDEGIASCDDGLRTANERIVMLSLVAVAAAVTLVVVGMARLAELTRFQAPRTRGSARRRDSTTVAAPPSSTDDTTTDPTTWATERERSGSFGSSPPAVRRPGLPCDDGSGGAKRLGR